MYFLVSIDKIRAYYKPDCQQNKIQRKVYTEQKLKLKENEPRVETNEQNKP